MATSSEIDCENFADSNEKISESIDYLQSLNEPSLIVNDLKACEKIEYLNKICQVRNFFDSIDWKMFTDKNCYELFGEIMYYLYEINNQIEFDNTSEFLKDNQKCFLFIHVIKLINSIVSKSLNFGAKFNRTRGLDAFFLILSDNQLSKRISVKHIDSINSICANLNWLSRVSEDTLKKWHSLDAVNILLGKLEKNSNAYISISQTLINIASDKELETMHEIETFIRLHVELLDKCVKDFEQEIFNREIKEFMADDNTIAKFKVHLIKINLHPTHFLTLTSILLLFYRLSINERIKLDLYFNHKIVEFLKIILPKASLIEKKYLLKLVAQLTFNKKIKDDLLLDKSFIEMITPCHKIDEFLVEITQQVRWNLGIKSQVCTFSNKKDTPQVNEHIMISYNTASRELCLKIKLTLESLGYKIWIDVNDIHGSSLDAMANAIENSFCVLMCVSEKYRQSINCQAEAQYAFRMNKKIIPLIMQNGYENVQGWLGIIMGDKIFVNFTKYDYDECIRRLKNELNAIKDKIINENQSINIPVVDNVANSSINITDKHIVKCSSEQVKKWFEKYNLNLDIFNCLKPCDGEILKQLYEMKRTAPEFYFKSLEKISDQMTLRSILDFTSRLCDLFS